jgi:hypothetical protein
VDHWAERLGTPENSNFYWRGAAIADVNQDGWFDIFTSIGPRNFLYLSRGDGTFHDATESAGLLKPGGVTSPLFFDYDRDGDPDLLCAHVGWERDGVPHGESLHLYRNDGEAHFTEVSAEVGLDWIHVNAFSTVAADFDGDGWLDVYICAYQRLDAEYPNSWHDATNGKPNVLLRNLGGKKFENIAGSSGVEGLAWSYAAAAADFDEDGDQDLYVANDYGSNNLYVNRGDGTFEDLAEQYGVLDTGNGMGATWGDLDGDGDLDLYVSNMSSAAGQRILKRIADSSSTGIEATLFKLAAGNSIFLQNENGFTRLAPGKGGVLASWAWGASLLDLDLDGHLDVYVANGFISGDSPKDT